MTDTPLPRFNVQQSTGSMPASPPTRAAAPINGVAPAPPSAGSSAPFASLLAGLQTVGQPLAASAPVGTLPSGPTDASLSKGIVGEIANVTDDATPTTSSLTKAAARSADTLKGATARSKTAAPDAIVQPGLIDPVNVIAIAQPAAPSFPRFVAASPSAGAGEIGSVRQASNAYALGTEGLGVTESPLAEAPATPAANAFSILSAVLPKTPAASDPGSSPQTGTPSLLGVGAANANQTALSSTAAKPIVTQPSQQVAPALVQLTHTASGGQLTLQLNPNELGRVHIQIDRAADGSAHVQVTAERAETLQLLIADQAQLHHALNNAGLPQDGRTLSLSLAKPETSAGEGFSGGSNGGSGSSAGERSSGQQGRPSSRGSDDEPGAWASGTKSATSSTLAMTRLRAGVDITA